VGIIIKSDREIEYMRQAGRIVARVLEMLSKEVRPGIKTKELDAIAARGITELGARPSFKGYHGFPANVCVSVNDEIVHGIPGERIIQEGDIVSIDMGAVYKGFQGDAAVTVGVGRIGPEAEQLLKATQGALEAGIEKARAGARLGDVSFAIQDYAESRGYAVVREYTGHGIGREMHEEPQILNYGQPGEGLLLKKGMTLAVEPMINIGDWRTRPGPDHWVVLTADGSLSAHFEHTIAITDGKAEVLTSL
jgi:methionyl aminopeptidase